MWVPPQTERGLAALHSHVVGAVLRLLTLSLVHAWLTALTPQRSLQRSSWTPGLRSSRLSLGRKQIGPPLPMALLQGDMFHSAHDLIPIVQLVLFIVAAAVRLPRVAALLRDRRVATTEALLLNVEEAVSPRAAPYNRGLFWLRAVHLACCASLLGIYAALLAAPPPGVPVRVLLGQVSACGSRTYS